MFLWKVVCRRRKIALFKSSAIIGHFLKLISHTVLRFLVVEVSHTLGGYFLSIKGDFLLDSFFHSKFFLLLHQTRNFVNFFIFRVNNNKFKRYWPFSVIFILRSMFVTNLKLNNCKLLMALKHIIKGKQNRAQIDFKDISDLFLGHFAAL